ncbi:hypothetical protein J2W32_001457 [Variovorax boronicumulans]|uniref:DUF4411 domain-containing protein n=1 Tax=Variovorax boronicumulans TaxID=436515 RepID=A0AAW8CVG8_9BURK|nr:DUF4411 family protein [Variovorax boronicumulans]MDP9893241.1 hypothetical protein [Variovorax boronicumulans]MDQ0052415.1 hypothetical protein [Variovorax boronicumulans]
MHPIQDARYSIDTSSLVHAWSRAYPPKNFISVWDRLESAIDQGVIVASVEVINEIKKKDDELHAWCKDRPPKFCIEIDDAQQALLAEILGKYPRLVDTVKGKSGGDPFVIALAQSYRRSLCIITEEGRGRIDSPKIPDVCQREDLRHLNIMQFIQAEGWEF